jgi:hypothetical protein
MSLTRTDFYNKKPIVVDNETFTLQAVGEKSSFKVSF